MRHKPLLVLLLVTVVLVIPFYYSVCLQAPQPRNYRVGILTRDGFEDVVGGFKKALQQWGYQNGVDIYFIMKNLDREQGTIDRNILSMLSEKPDVIFSVTFAPTKALLASHGQKLPPLVFWGMLNPVEEGLVMDLNYPAGNVTGVWGKYLAGKNLEFLKRAVPSVKKIFLPYGADAGVTGYIAEAREAAELLGLELREKQVSTAEEFKDIVEELDRSSVDAILQIPTSALRTNYDFLVQKALKMNLPLSVSLLSNARKDGALISYSFDVVDSGRQAGIIVAAALQGRPVGTIPVRTNMLYRLMINQATARYLGITIPEELVRLAEMP